MVRCRRRFGGLALDSRGSAPVEFVLVGVVLTVLTLAIVQFGVAVYVRNVVHDAAVEGAHRAALADTTLAEGEARTRDVISRTVGAAFAEDVSARDTEHLGYPAVEVTVRTTLPLIGLIGMPWALEVTAHAPAETLD
ncbi:TadE/TadG family type IV pilus assembly protein [Microbacterium sp.]|jgi:Flp pilus assembly protein TadG|uniref:TadE/TadG family type IV pilus assembly protein n=1 Tax=Microbacterium sp. TaxID=51671 RepID=UPI0037CB8007